MAGLKQPVGGETNFTPTFQNRNLVEIQWMGEGPPPKRELVVHVILDIGFRVEYIFAFINPSGSSESDLFFVRAKFFLRFLG